MKTSLLSRIINKLVWLYKLYIYKDQFTVALNSWHKGGHEQTSRYNFPLDEDSLVWDVGGFLGDWSKKIHDIYNCNIEIF